MLYLGHNTNVTSAFLAFTLAKFPPHGACLSFLIMTWQIIYDRSLNKKQGSLQGKYFWLKVVVVPFFSFCHLADFVLQVAIPPKAKQLRGVPLTHLLQDVPQTMLHFQAYFSNLLHVNLFQCLQSWGLWFQLSWSKGCLYSAFSPLTALIQLLQW